MQPSDDLVHEYQLDVLNGMSQPNTCQHLCHSRHSYSFSAGSPRFPIHCPTVGVLFQDGDLFCIGRVNDCNVPIDVFRR